VRGFGAVLQFSSISSRTSLAYGRASIRVTGHVDVKEATATGREKRSDIILSGRREKGPECVIFDGVPRRGSKL